jgi:hypothetical protein
VSFEHARQLVGTRDWADLQAKGFSLSVVGYVPTKVAFNEIKKNITRTHSTPKQKVRIGPLLDFP